MKLLVFSKYSRNGASSRYRMFQYYSFLRSRGLVIETQSLFDEEYLNRLYAGESRLTSVLFGYARRLRFILSAGSYDVLWVEKELFPWIPWFIEKAFYKILGTPFVVDYDDAIFHQYDNHRMWVVRALLGKKCDRVMASSACVFAGNEYLARRARESSANKVEIIPTVVSEKVFTPRSAQSPVPVIGWIGSKSTSVYLEKLRPVFIALLKHHSFLFRVVGASLDWKEVPVDNVSWSEAKEVSLIQTFDLGVMPLLDSPWERGKCGFKLIQYMACGKPVVADSVGANMAIVSEGVNGFLVNDLAQWEDALSRILSNLRLREDMGLQGRQRFEQHYSLECWQEFLLGLLQDAQQPKPRPTR